MRIPPTMTMRAAACPSLAVTFVIGLLPIQDLE